MTDEHRVVRVRLELDPDRAPIRGKLVWSRGEVRFEGWLEFSEIVEEILSGRPDAGS